MAKTKNSSKSGSSKKNTKCDNKGKQKKDTNKKK